MQSLSMRMCQSSSLVLSALVNMRVHGGIHTQIVPISRKRKCLVPPGWPELFARLRELLFPWAETGAAASAPAAPTTAPESRCQTITRASLTMPISGRPPAAGAPTRLYLADDPWKPRAAGTSSGADRILSCRGTGWQIGLC